MNEAQTNLEWRQSPARAIVLALALSVNLGSCGDGNGRPGDPSVGTQSPPPPARVVLSGQIRAYDAASSGYRGNNGRWYSYQQSRTACPTEFGGFPNNPYSPPSCFVWLTPPQGAGRDWVSSVGPWWVDVNHMQLPGGDGYGFIHVLAFTQIPGALYAPLDLDGTMVRFTARKDAIFSTLEADSRDGLRKGHVYLWIQTFARPLAPCTPDPQIGENCTRQSDYIMTGGYAEFFEVDTQATAEGKSLSFDLSADRAADWTCLGRGVNVKYDCRPITEALRNVAAIGFVLAPVPACPTVPDSKGGEICDLAKIDAEPGRHFAGGRFDIRGFTLDYPETRPNEAALLTFVSTPASQITWSLPRPAAREVFREGSGLYIPAPITAGAMTVGLSREVQIDGGDAPAYELYLITTGVENSSHGNEMRIRSRDPSRNLDRVLFVAPFDGDDTFSMHLRNDQLLFLKNDVTIHSEPSPCPTVGDCLLTPYIRAFRLTQPVPVYRY